MEQQAQVAEEKRRPIPAWAAGAGAAVFLLIIGGFIYWFMGGSFGGSGDLIPDPARAQQQQANRGRGGWRQPAIVDGVQPMNNGSMFLVKTGAAMMEVFPAQDKKGPPTFRFRYDTQQLVTPDQFHLVMGLRRIAGDTKMAETLDISQDQLERLRRYGQVQMELTKADREKLEAAWGDYDKANAKDEPEKKLVALLKDAGARALGPTKVHIVERLGDIGRILTPDQARELTKLGAGQNVTAIPHTAHPAATKPTTRAL